MQALLGTRKGLVILSQGKGGWRHSRTHFDGIKTSYAVADPGRKLIWAGVAHGHWGPKLHVSKNQGKTFTEVGIPKFPEGGEDSLKDFWAYASDERGRMWLGVEPAALFYSDDEGSSWTLCESLYALRLKDKWFGGGTDSHCLHSLMINPDNEDHLIIGISVAGMLESTDRGRTWRYANKGLKAYFMPDPDTEVGQDPHMTIMAPSNPNILWQQNHCGIFKSHDMGRSWTDLSKAKGVKSAFGWGITVDEDDEDIAYTIPAQSDETRVPVKKRIIVQRTQNGGKSWDVLSKGFPKEDCYDIVYRHAFALKEKTLIFGSTTGNVFFSNNRGESWKQFPMNFPPVYSVKLF